MKIELSTTDSDGRRKWIYPLVSRGFWWRLRLVTAIALILWLLVAPWIRYQKNQLLFFDLIQGRVVFFGHIFWINETIIFLSLIFFFISIILFVTALFGRVFCGWACPMTVFMEFVFRPIEQWIDGKTRPHQPVGERIPQLIFKWGLFSLIALILGNTFVAYILGSHRLLEMIKEGPAQNQLAFFSMLGASAAILFQFGWFREQVCLFVCPYGRLQSILLDKESLIVAYDKNRGEPRGKPSQVTGDCVDCKMCIKVCPTGIDIRNGLQLECIHCTQCIDACDTVMDKLKRPRGLIRYQTESQVENSKPKILRPRLIAYGIFSFLIGSILVFLVTHRSTLAVTIHREQNQVFTVDNAGYIVNPIRVHLRNKSDTPCVVEWTNFEPAHLQIETPEGLIQLAPLEKRTVHILTKIPKEIFIQNNGLIRAKLDVRQTSTAAPSLSSHVPVELYLLGPSQ